MQIILKRRVYLIYLKGQTIPEWLESGEQEQERLGWDREGGGGVS